MEKKVWRVGEVAGLISRVTKCSHLFLWGFGLISHIIIGKDTARPVVGAQRLERALQLFLSRLSFKTTFRENQYFDS